MAKRTSLEVIRLSKPAAYLAYLFRELKPMMVPGITTEEIAEICERFLTDRRLESTLSGYRGFPAAACVSVNNVAAHGIPGEYRLRDGDVVTVDVGAGYAGWKADAAWTYAVGTVGPGARRLISAAWKSCCAGMRVCRPGNRVGDIGSAIQVAAAGMGCSVVPQFFGHGIGRDVHEEPAIPHVSQSGSGEVISAGMVMNIEPVVCLGRPEVTLLNDGWSYVTADGSATAQFEHTVAVFAGRTRVLTLPELDLDKDGDDFPPFY